MTFFEPISPAYQPRPGKFVIPSRLPDLLRRQRLLDFLHDNIHRKLILVSAAAGYGKSSTLIEFAHDTDYPVAWFQLEAADADLAAFASGLVAALKRVYPQFDSVLPALVARPGARMDELASAFVRELDSALEEYCVVVLDDFHLVEDSPQVTAFVDALLAGLPEQAHIVVSSRTLPPLRMVTLAARQQAAGLNEERLRFTADEVKQLVQTRRKVTLSDGDAEGIVSDTEGWITGILLTAQLMWQGVMPDLPRARSSESPVYDFLADEVLDIQPEPLRRFLMESAVLPEMEPRVCDEVLGRSDSKSLLFEAESRHLFVHAVGEENRAYRYHHLFRDFLLVRLRTADAGRLRSLQVRTAEWYAAHSMPEAGVTFFVAAGEFEKAAAIAEQHAQRMFMMGRQTTLQNWHNQLAEVVDYIPRVCLYLSKLQIDSDVTLAHYTFDQAAQGFARRNDLAGKLACELLSAGWMFDRGEVEACLTLVEECAAQARSLRLTVDESNALRLIGLSHAARGEFDKAEEAFISAIRLMQQPDRRFDLAVTLGDFANLLRARGQTARSALKQQEALGLWREAGVPSQLAISLNNTGYDLHMLAQYDNAYATFKEALTWARKSGNVRAEVFVLLSEGDLFADLGDTAVASDLYSQALAKAGKLGDKQIVAYLYRGMARLNRLAGNFAAALEWLRRSAIAAGEAKIPYLNLEGLRGIILVEAGRVTEGRAVLESACTQLIGLAVLSDQVQTFLLLACAQYRDGDVAKSAMSLEQAFAMAERIGYDQMLMAEALATRDVLQAFAQHPVIGRQANNLLTRAGNLTKVRERLTQATVPSAASQSTGVEVRALGVGRILRDGVEIAGNIWRYQRLREIFLFIVDRAPVHRDLLLTTFWPDKLRMRASANLRQSLYLIRRIIGYDTIVIVGDECQLASDISIGYDVANFEAAVRTAVDLAPGDLRRLGALTAAAALFSGEYLADMSSDWINERRRTLATLGITVLKDYADELMNLTRYSDARKVLDRALSYEPIRDDLHERMLLCLAQMGLRHEVVKHYLHYQDYLRVELGLDPPPEIRALYSRLIA